MPEPVRAQFRGPQLLLQRPALVPVAQGGGPGLHALAGEPGDRLAQRVSSNVLPDLRRLILGQRVERVVGVWLAANSHRLSWSRLPGSGFTGAVPSSGFRVPGLRRVANNSELGTRNSELQRRGTRNFGFVFIHSVPANRGRRR